jgi:hypothetical protein
MKNVYLLFIAICICLSACKKDEFGNKVDASYQKWTAFKKSNNNSYTYTVYSSSIFGGYAETKFTVKNGRIITREYLSGYYKSHSDTLTVRASWTENESTLNTHGTSGYDLLTIDEIYNKAKSVWLKVDPKENAIYFEADNDGIISSAGYVPNGCQDDCFNGMNIKDIKPLVNAPSF